jgi:hypothetical protein
VNGQKTQPCDVTVIDVKKDTTTKIKISYDNI